MGHIGIGYPNPDQETTEKIVKAFDLFVVLPSLLKDNDTKRRELYGKAGSFRFTPYGVECRALSNYWIHSDDSMRWVFNQTILAVNLVLDNNIDHFISKYSKKAERIINTSNFKSAAKLIKEIELNLITV